MEFLIRIPCNTFSHLHLIRDSAGKVAKGICSLEYGVYMIYHQHFGSDISQNQRLFRVCAVPYLHAAHVSVAPRHRYYCNAKDADVMSLPKCW